MTGLPPCRLRRASCQRRRPGAVEGVVAMALSADVLSNGIRGAGFRGPQGPELPLPKQIQQDGEAKDQWSRAARRKA